jgi:hypothetical protein
VKREDKNTVTIYQLKPAFQNLLRPLCRALARRALAEVTP